MNWFATHTCEAAANFGWFIGVATGLFVAVSITLLIASASRLNPSGDQRLAEPEKPAPATRCLHGWLKRAIAVGLPIVWLAGGWWVGSKCAGGYGTTLAIAAALVVGMMLLVGFVTAANHVGARSIQ